MDIETQKLFEKMKDFTDDEDIMKQFASLIVTFSNHMKGNTKCVAICSGDFKFQPGRIFIMYDDMSSNDSFKIFEAKDFINYVIDGLSEEEDDDDIKFIFKPELENIIGV